MQWTKKTTKRSHLLVTLLSGTAPHSAPRQGRMHGLGWNLVPQIQKNIVKWEHWQKQWFVKLHCLSHNHTLAKDLRILFLLFYGTCLRKPPFVLENPTIDKLSLPLSFPQVFRFPNSWKLWAFSHSKRLGAGQGRFPVHCPLVANGVHGPDRAPDRVPIKVPRFGRRHSTASNTAAEEVCWQTWQLLLLDVAVCAFTRLKQQFGHNALLARKCLTFGCGSKATKR